jgi:cell division protein FtsQ
MLGVARAFVWRRRSLRVALLVLLAALPLLGGGWLLLRNSSFVAVQRVQVSGVHGPQAQAIDTALLAAARQMSTLNLHVGQLRAAVAPFRVVREVKAAPRFPHGLRIEVLEQPPVAALVVGGARTAVAADGVVLGPTLLTSRLPTVSGYHEPAAGQRVNGPDLLAALTVLGAAPAALMRDIERVFTGAKGLTVAMRNGLQAYFGDATRPHAKWLSLVRVLADPSSAGASYVDVRLPGRPAAGFPSGVAPSATSASEQSGASESTVASLAAALTRGTAASEPPSGTTGASASEPVSESSSEALTEGSPSAGGETRPGTGAAETPSSVPAGG